MNQNVDHISAVIFTVAIALASFYFGRAAKLFYVQSVGSSVYDRFNAIEQYMVPGWAIIGKLQMEMMDALVLTID